MAAGPVRKLLNPPPQETEIQLTGDQDTKNKKTPFSMKELMVLNKEPCFWLKTKAKTMTKSKKKKFLSLHRKPSGKYYTLNFRA